MFTNSILQRSGFFFFAFPFIFILGMSPASAATISITSQITTGTTPVEGDAAPLPGAVNFLQGVVGSVSGSYESPYANNTPFNVISVAGGDAIYNVGASSYSVLWGSPDSYNEIEFFAGADGMGGQIGSTLTGCDLTQNACTGAGFDLVTFMVSTGGTIGSVELINTAGPAAFEFGTVSATPLPATLPLFAAGFAGFGMLARRRRSKPQPNCRQSSNKKASANTPGFSLS
jgi:hypothetical protein